MNYYLVKAKCGHVGKEKYYEVDFPIKALSKSDAAQICKRKPKVKKHLKDAISSVIEISYEEFKDSFEKFQQNDYVKAHTKNEILEYIELAQSLVHTPTRRKHSFASREERLSFLFKKQRQIEKECYIYA